MPSVPDYMDPWDDEANEVPESDTPISDLDAFDEYLPPVPSGTAVHSWDSELPDNANDSPDVFFTVSNPAGNVAVTALLGGRIDRIDLQPSVCKMTESELSEEITFLSALASQKALAAQHGVITLLMQDVGYEGGLVHEFLERDLGLPSPESYVERVATAFSGRYGQG